MRFLAEVCRAEVTGAEAGSETVEFIPEWGATPSCTSSTTTTPSRVDGGERATGDGATLTPIAVAAAAVQPEYVIELHTAGSVFLVFQALYPYLLRAGAGSGPGRRKDGKLHLRITGGTNVPKAPSFDYVAQVLVPTLRRLGFPALDVRLRERGWSTGPRAANRGAVEIRITPLEGDGPETARFPMLHLDRWTRGAVVGVEVTVLAPDDPLETINRSEGGRTTTVREYLAGKTLKAVGRALKSLAQRGPERGDVDEKDTIETAGEDEDDAKEIPVTIHTSEKTYHQAHIYILLVAHTANGFRLGVDGLFGGFGDGGKGKGKSRRSKNKNQYKYEKQKDSKRGPRQAAGKNQNSEKQSSLDAFVDSCVGNLLEELLPEDSSESADQTPSRHRPCVDVHMRDQLVIFDALARVDHGAPARAVSDESLVENDKYWSLHTQTARWMCEEILGPGLWHP